MSGFVQRNVTMVSLALALLATADVLAADPANGNALYHGKYRCTDCHTPTPGPNSGLSSGSTVAGLTNAIDNVSAMTRRFSLTLEGNANDLADIAAYLASVTGGALATLVTVVEYYNASLDHYFITWVPAEIGILDAGVTIRGWTRTGYTFKAYSTSAPGASPVCRFYIPPAYGDSHFFGRGQQECDETAAKFPQFVNEDPHFMYQFLPVGGACPAGTIEVHRAFSNRADANHRYFIDASIGTQMLAQHWLLEGDGPDLVVMCAPA